MLLTKLFDKIEFGFKNDFKVLFFIMDALLDNFNDLIRNLILKNFNLFHLIFAEVCAMPLLYLVKNFVSIFYKEANFDQDTNLHMTITSIIYSAIMISGMIFGEVIILNFCGFESNTRKRIIEREKKERLSKMEENNDNTEDLVSSTQGPSQELGNIAGKIAAEDLK